VLGPIAMLIAGAGPSAAWGAAALLLVQYLVTALSARHAGERFVCNVLAIHSATKITAAKTTSN